jgi:sigma-B regulation protein RsbU (phosphoserine phosphatase)
MVIAPLPEDETERLENLESYHVLDTPFDAVFDEIASLAGKICGVPYAFISLLDRKRQWFKAAYGWKGERETPRDVSFCSHAILQDDVLHVPDARLDERFHDNPFVTGELGVRVYAGVPLVSEEGYKLGTLCVLSDRPAKLDHWQTESLKQLSRVIGVLFKGRQEEVRLQLMSRVLDELPDEIMLADTSTLRSIYANAATLHATKTPRNRAGRLTLGDMLKNAAPSSVGDVIKAVKEGTTNRMVVEVERPGHAGKSGHGTLEMHLQRLRFGHHDTIIAVGHDIGERKRAEKIRAILQEQLEQRNLELSRAYEQLTKEMTLARDTQMQFLPLPQCIGKACFDWLFLASSYLSGDIFDYFPLDDRYVCFHVTDVSGHGVAAALLAFNIQRQMYSSKTDMLFLLHSRGGDVESAASMVVREINRKFCAANPTGMYLTMVFGLLDTETGRTAIVQAGHPYPLFTDSSTHPVRALGQGGLPIGILRDADYEAVMLDMQPGSRLYLYSDGISEALDETGRQFGMEGLAGVVEGMRAVPLSDVKAAVEQAITTWQAGVRERADDITFVVLEYDNRN